MLLLLWIIVFVMNLYYAIILAGTTQSLISLLFVALAIYFIIKHVGARLTR